MRSDPSTEIPANDAGTIRRPLTRRLRPGTVILTMGAGLVLGMAMPELHAGDGKNAASGGSTAALAEKEIARRSALLSRAEELMVQAGKAFGTGDFATAAEFYRQAYQLLPESAVTADARGRALAGFADSAIRRAGELGRLGRYDEADTLLGAVLADDFDPENSKARKLRQQLKDPERYNPALSPAHLEKVQLVKKALTLAAGHASLGENHKARAAYNEALAIDPYNTTARRGLESLEHAISTYHLSARDHTRADAFRQIDEKWEVSVPPSVADAALRELNGKQPDRGGSSGSHSVREKMTGIILPSIAFDQATLEEAVSYLQSASKNADTMEADPARKGVNILLRGGPASAGKKITVNPPLQGLPLGQAIQYVADLAGLRMNVDDYLVTLGEATGGNGLTTRNFRVPPGFITSTASATPAETADPFAAPAAATGTGKLTFVRQSASDFLKQSGVQFPDGATAGYNAATNTLTVTNTPGNIDLVEVLVNQSLQKSPMQVMMRVFMLEVNQENMKELGVDTLLGAANLPGAPRLYTAGGTGGNLPSANAQALGQNFPVAAPDGTVSGGTPVTAGNRSSDALNNVTTIDSLLAGERNGTSSGVKSPAIFGVAGIFTDPAFQTVLRGLNQKKGTDISSAPTVIAKSGQRAKVQVIREFRYPTEFDPPEIPQTFGNTGNNNNNNVFSVPPGNQFPVTPTTPTNFESRDVGDELEIEATIGPDNQTIELDISPSISDFEGFVNYGTPIVQFLDTGTTPVVVTENRIPQPIFRVSRTQGVKVTLWSGHTAAIGGMVHQESVKMNDKTPILGDLPLIGGLFRSQIEKVKSKAVLFFVTARIIDPAGETPEASTAKN